MVKMDIRRFKPLEYQTKEAINTLCANLSFIGGDIKKVLITSCRPQEGKTMVSMELMRAMAGLGMKVVLVDADIRASAIQSTYDIAVYSSKPDKEPYLGLTRYLAGYCSQEDILGSTNIPNAYMILSGKLVTNSLPLLNSVRLQTLIDSLAMSFDIVIIDAPPVGTIIDAAKIGAYCDGTLFVVKSGNVSSAELLDAMAQIEKAGSPILGTVLSQYDSQKYGEKYYKNSKYTKYYGAENVNRRRSVGRPQKKSKKTGERPPKAQLRQ